MLLDAVRKVLCVRHSGPEKQVGWLGKDAICHFRASVSKYGGAQFARQNGTLGKTLAD